MTKVFVSYREDDAKGWAVLLSDRLAEIFGPDTIFLDQATLAPGPWRSQIDQALQRCAVVLVVIGRRWLRAADDRGPRLWQPEDVHRQEIETVLGRPDVTVIPVLVDGVAMPRAEELPPSIRELAGWQSRTLSSAPRGRHVDLENLVSEIGEIAGLTPRRRAAETRWIGTALRILIVTIGTTIGLLIAAQVTVGWDFPPEQVSVIVVAVLIIVTVIASFRRSRARRSLGDGGR